MDLFGKMSEEGHEQVMFFRGRAGGLKGIVALHDTTLGPALGGTRMFPYGSEDEAIIDSLRLSKGMTQKSGACGNHFGGGKGVIWGDPEKDKGEMLFRAYGRYIQGLNGRFITGTDVGTVSSDFVHCLSETNHVVGLPTEYGGSGDTSILTAYGVFLGILACLEEVFGHRHLAGLTVAIQGAGKVGSKLCRLLRAEGANLVVSDIRSEAAETVAKELGGTTVSPEDVLSEEADILSPNAMGGILNEATIARIRAKIVAGAANNQLLTPQDSIRLFDRGILYAPDYVINAGGAIQAADEVGGYDAARCKAKVERIPGLLKTIFEISKKEDIDTTTAADRMVQFRLARALELKSISVFRGRVR